VDHTAGRLPADVRWTGRLQQLLGAGFRIIEEGLGGRTTDLDPATRAGRNGRTYFGPCLESHHPLGVLVIMLGTNDLKTEFSRPPAAVADAVGGYLHDVERLLGGRTAGKPRTVIVSPAHLDDTRPLFAAVHGDVYDRNAVAASKRLAVELRRVAHAAGAGFVDAACVAVVGDDGVHLRLDGHRLLAGLLAHTIRSM
jgi:lysophospholipase L1-like esterase